MLHSAAQPTGPRELPAVKVNPAQVPRADEIPLQPWGVHFLLRACTLEVVQGEELLRPRTPSSTTRECPRSSRSR
jgi:hypothetical protein